MSGSGIGSTLKDARTKKSVTLEDVHAKIKIHPRVLQLLEEEKFDKLPSPLFVKNFLKSYAEFLEINPEELLGKYEKEKLKDPEQVLFIKPADPSMNSGIHPFYIIAGVCGALLVLMLALGEPARSIKFIGSKMKAVKTTAEKTKKAAKEKNEDIPKTSSVSSAAQEENLSSDWLNAVSMGNFPKINRKTPLALEIKALDAVWVHVTADGAVVFQGILKKGSSEQWTAKEKVELWTGNASNMSLNLNKYALGSPGKGVVKKMIISHEGVRIATPA